MLRHTPSLRAEPQVVLKSLPPARFPPPPTAQPPPAVTQRASADSRGLRIAAHGARALRRPNLGIELGRGGPASWGAGLPGPPSAARSCSPPSPLPSGVAR
ncbi:uncharacterized protein LOC143201679 [Rhynchophorus ferrugineus]|uniref:uncharacterized protein LOC143201679 n=1 Tax=Rhynchophorus ferrugineus TaxID=354439 RepID=UPI003FCDD732